MFGRVWIGKVFYGRDNYRFGAHLPDCSPCLTFYVCSVYLRTTDETNMVEQA